MFYNLLFIAGFVPAVTGQSLCNNTDFESSALGTYTSANAVTGWTISSQTVTSCISSTVWTPGSPEFSIISTPVFTAGPIGTLGNSPLGGSKIVQLNNFTPNSTSTRLSKTFSVNPSGGTLNLAYALLLEDGSHYCCDQTSMFLRFRHPSGSILSCVTISTSSGGAYCPSGAVGYSISGNYSWSNWVSKSIDLSPYGGMILTFEVIVSDCTCGQHRGTLFFDASCSPPLNPSNEINFCPTSTVATISGPSGFISYSWTGYTSFWSAPTPSAAKTITIGNPVPGNVYTLTATLPSGCMYLYTYTLAHSGVSANNLVVSPSCPNGTTGSATVLATGSSSGYQYSWKNNAGQSVGTNSYITNMPSGQYSLVVTAINNTACGSYVTNVLISSQGPFSVLPKPYCQGQSAYLSTTAGSNFQWYDQSIAVPGNQGGTASSFTVTNPLTSSVVCLSYSNNTTGCRDSIQYFFIPAPQGTLIIPASLVSPYCAGKTGSAGIVLVRATNSPGNNTSFSVSSIGISPPFSSSSGASTFTSFPVNGMQAGTYSVNAFDSFCQYSSTFAVIPFTLNTILYLSSNSVCAGKTQSTHITTTQQGSHSFTWAPQMWMTGNPNNNSTAHFSPNIQAGTMLTQNFSVTVKHVQTGCAVTHTFDITAAAATTPTISFVPKVCANAAPFTLTAQPPGGAFSGTGLDANGVMTPTLVTWPYANIEYTYKEFFCTSKSYTYAEFLQLPPISISGKTLMCSGAITTLSVIGPVSYTIAGQQNTPLVISPSVTTIYPIMATHTLNNCTGSKQITVNVTPTPKLTLPKDTSICIPTTTMLLSSPGAQNYLWSNGSTATAITVMHNQPHFYSLVATNNPGNCRDTAFINIHINTMPVLSVNEDFNICTGDRITIEASGASSYSWNGVPGTSSISVNPHTTSVYKLTGNDHTKSCYITNNVTVTVDECTAVPVQQGLNIRAFPNPFSSFVIIEVEEEFVYRLVNSMGAFVKEGKGINWIDFKTYDVPPGFYVLEIYSTAGPVTYKLLKGE
jgi:hypothetical protein